MTDTQKQLEKNLGFNCDGEDFSVRERLLMRELVSTTERIERISKAAKQFDYEIAAAFTKTSDFMQQTKLRQAREALRKELL